MKAPIIIIICLCTALGVNAQNILSQFTLRQSFQSKTDRAEPAIISYTNPENKPESWLLNAAIGVNILPNTRKVLTLEPYAEYHRNTLSEKEQNNWQIGLASEWQSRDISTKKWSPIFIASARYNEDKVKKNTSMQGNIYVTLLLPGKDFNPKYFWHPNNAADFGKLFRFIYTPYLGLENENRLATTSTGEEGNIYRLFGRITPTITLLTDCEHLNGRIQLTADWQYRYDFSESVENLTKKEHNFMTLSVNYIFYKSDDDSKSAQIGFDYVKGENPTKGFEQQAYQSINLKVKL